MSGLNADWHRANPIPTNPTLDQRIAWHLEHAKACGCRDIPETLRAEIARRGLKVPAARGRS
jgi:hypothetical protein